MLPFAEFEGIRVGDCQELTKTITETDVRRFVDMTGDDNPLHVDRRFAEKTSFKDVVVHGMLGASFISTVIGTRLPGPGALWLSQTLDFLQPVRLGDELRIVCTVSKKHDAERLLDIDTMIFNQRGHKVLVGSGMVKVLKPPAVETRSGGLLVGQRAAIVTGGGGGIGQAVCRLLAERGVNVVVGYLGRKERAQSLVDEINSDGKATAIAVQADLSADVGGAELFEAAVRAFGEVSILVNGASPHIGPKAFRDLQWKDIQGHVDAQVRSAFVLSKLCLPGMLDRRYGRIVNITSQVTEGPPTQSWTAYAMAKSALTTMSRYLAAECGPSFVTVNCVSPGMTDTGLIGEISEKVQLMVARQTPLRRLAAPEDIAAAVGFLVSDEACYVTGQTLRVNGGMVM